MNRTGQMLRSLQLAFHERLVDDHLRCDVGKLTPLPGPDLFSHGFEVALNPVHSDRNAVDQRKRLRLVGEHRRKRTIQCQALR